MSDANRYNYIPPYKIFQMKREISTGIITELWELSRASYVDDLSPAEIRDLFSNPDKLYSKNYTHITNWGVDLDPSTPSPGFPRLAPHDGRCYCFNREDNGFFDYFVRVVFHDGVINLARIVFTIVHYQPWLETFKIALHDDHHRYPSNINVKCFYGAPEGIDPYYSMANRTLFMYRKETMNNQRTRGNPYDLPHDILKDRGSMDQYTLVVQPTSPEIWLKHAVSYVDFLAEGEFGSAFDISRILIFGANTEMCVAPEIAEDIVKVWNTQQLAPPNVTGGPVKCIDDTFLEDPDNFLSYNYGPRTTLVEHYEYLRRNHANDFFTAIPILEVLYEGTPLTVTNGGEINTLLLPGIYEVIFDGIFDIYQFNIEYSGALRDSNGDTTIYITTYNEYDEIGKIYTNSHQFHEGSNTIHQRSRGVVSKWFPGYPWHTHGKTCLMKNCWKVVFEVVHPGGFLGSPLLGHILARTRATTLICRVNDDPEIPFSPYPPLPNRNTNTQILGDWAANTSYTWDPSKSTYTSSVFQSPAYGINSIYPDFVDNTTYAILDKKYTKWFSEQVIGGGDSMLYLFDGYLHPVDYFNGNGSENKITFSTPSTISFIRVFVLGPMEPISWMRCKIETTDGYISEEKEFQIQEHQSNITGPGEHPTYRGGYFRTLPWDPDQQSLFTNLRSISFFINCNIVGFQLWGNYIKSAAN